MARLAVVTGADRGHGAAVARALEVAGLEVHRIAARAVAGVETTVDAGDRSDLETVDTGDRSALEALAESLDPLSPECLVNDGVDGGPGSEEAIAWLYLTRLLLPGLLRRGRGTVVHLSPERGPGDLGDYANLARRLADEHRGAGVRFHAVEPAAGATPGASASAVAFLVSDAEAASWDGRALPVERFEAS